VAGALRRATLALADAPDAAPRRVVVLLTDGAPTAPRETERENLVETLRAADRAARHEVRVLSFAIGEALERPVAALEIAERTGGAFYPVRDATDLPDVFRLVQLDQIAELEVRNLTAGGGALHLRLGAEGSWDAIVPLAPGPNRLEIRARTELGGEAVRELALSYEPGATTPTLSVGLEPRRAAARAAELADVTTRGAALERTVVEQARARLLAEIARERAAAARTGEAQRRELALEAERPAGADEPDVAAGAQ
jgi:hypothetical protein